MSIPLISIVIVNYQSRSFLRDCLQSLDNQTFQDFEIIVVNNDTDPLDDIAPAIKVIESDENIGFAAACNLGFKSASSKWFIALNPDTKPHPDWLVQLLESSETHSDIKIWGSLQLKMENPDLVDGFGDNLSIFGYSWRGGNGGLASSVPSIDSLAMAACAAALFIDAKIYRFLGGFDEKYFCYLEDMDLGVRATLAGFKVGISTKAVVLHAGGASSLDAPKFSEEQYYRNNWYFLSKNLPRRYLPLTFLGYWIIGTVLTVKKSENIAVCFHNYRTFIRGVSGTIVGLRARRGVKKTKEGKALFRKLISASLSEFRNNEIRTFPL